MLGLMIGVGATKTTKPSDIQYSVYQQCNEKFTQQMPLISFKYNVCTQLAQTAFYENQLNQKLFFHQFFFPFQLPLIFCHYLTFIYLKCCCVLGRFLFFVSVLFSLAFVSCYSFPFVRFPF